MAKGIIKIEVFKDRLRLRWSTSGDRFCIYVGLPDTKINRSAAEAKARQIELDIISGNFDRTLKKYKPEVKISESRITVADLFEKYCEHKAKVNEKPTQVKYLAVLARLREFFDKKLVEDLTTHDCEKFLIWLEKYNAKRTIKDRLSILKACWQWNNEKNVWEEVAGKVKVPPQQKPKPFTKEEITMIINAFRGDRYYKPYADYVEFLFGTGCRTGEVIGLRWKHLSDDCSTAWIGESFVRGTRKATKTNRDRVIPVRSPKLV
jgi:integrase